MSGFVEDKSLLRAELRFASTTGGAQFVITCGMLQMLKLCVTSSDFLLKVSLVRQLTSIT